MWRSIKGSAELCIRICPCRCRRQQTVWTVLQQQDSGHSEALLPPMRKGRRLWPRARSTSPAPLSTTCTPPPPNLDLASPCTRLQHLRNLFDWIYKNACELPNPTAIIWYAGTQAKIHDLVATESPRAPQAKITSMISRTKNTWRMWKPKCRNCCDSSEGSARNILFSALF